MQATLARECTPDEGAQWQERYTTGYCHGRSDTLNGDVRWDVVTEIPAEIPGETGARYVARHLDLAYRIAYTRAVAFYAAMAR